MEKFTERINSFVSQSVPRERRLLAAKGQIAVLPAELATILYALMEDSDEEIRKLSEETMKSLPADTISKILSDEMTPPELLDYFARTSSDVNQTKAIILNQSTSEQTIQHIAKTTHSQDLLELIASNKESMFRSESIVEAICSNPSLNRSTMDELISYLRQHVTDDDKVPDFLRAELSEKPSEDYRVPTEGNDERLIDFSSNFTSGPQDAFLDKVELSDDFMREPDEEVSEKNRGTMFSKITRMNFSERLKLAVLGNREARSLLIRDRSKLIACSVLKNPRLTESEVVLFAQSKLVEEDVLRTIAETRRWVRHYQIKYSLVSNPKTPTHISLNFMRYIRDRDLRSIMNDKNIPGVVKTAAARVIKERIKGDN